MQSVPSGIIASTPIEEQKRQERIYELINTEQDYARDLRYVHNVSQSDKDVYIARSQ